MVNTTADLRSRQLHIYRNGKKILILAGKGFHSNDEFQDCLHNNAGKTYKEAVAAYHSIEHPKEIKPQFEYNQYIRDFFADNKGATLKDAIRCWYWKKLQPGSHRYEKSDIDAVED